MHLMSFYLIQTIQPNHHHLHSIEDLSNFTSQNRSSPLDWIGLYLFIFLVMALVCAYGYWKNLFQTSRATPFFGRENEFDRQPLLVIHPRTIQ